jgi:hypothetical protein
MNAALEPAVSCFKVLLQEKEEHVERWTVVPGGSGFRTLAPRPIGGSASPSDQVGFISIFLWVFWASAVFGSVILRTPLPKVAATLSRSTPSGT